jgi:hypothetical protein
MSLDWNVRAHMLLAFRDGAHPLPQLDNDVDFLICDAFDHFFVTVGKAIRDNHSGFMQPLDLALAVLHLPLPSMQHAAIRHAF